MHKVQVTFLLFVDMLSCKGAMDFLAEQHLMRSQKSKCRKGHRMGLHLQYRWMAMERFRVCSDSWTPGTLGPDAPSLAKWLPWLPLQTAEGAHAVSEEEASP